MALPQGTRLGPYEVLGPIGAGGMGEVYKATDTRLSRTVAIKVLPSHFAGDPEMKQRFEREAQTIAGLNHPNICILHDIGEQDGTHFLVMEYVEGETLADRISRGPLPLGEALQIAGEVVDALDKAHRQGIVHRDLKPANIMLAKAKRAGAATATKIITAPDESPVKPASGAAAGSAASAPKSGRSSSSAPSLRSSSSHTKLLDFGLAKWVAPGGSNPISAQSTRMDMTTQGAMIGTLQYMAPEQVEGKEADARTDLFAFGAVMYEMLTGKRAFEGKSQASLLGAIMKAEPRPISHHAPETPAVLEHMIARCLVKDPEERWQDAHSLRLKLQWIARHRDSAQVAAPARTWRDVAVWATLGVLLAGVSVPAYLYWRGSAEPAAIQFRHTVAGLSEADLALAPNGTAIAFVAKPDTATPATLFVRPTGDLTAVKLAGTDNASQPFWSPDSQFIAYFSSGKLRKISESGGAIQDLCIVTDMFGGSWTASEGGTIVFGTSKGLFKVSAEGGPATPVSQLGEGEAGHFWPSFLPDGKHVVYLGWSEDPAKRGLYAGSIDSKDRTRLSDAESNPVYATTPSLGSQLLFHRQATLFAQPFDPKALRFTGDPAQIVGEVSTAANGFGKFSASMTGALVYYQGLPGASTTGRARVTTSQFGWIDRGGGRSGAALDPGQYGDMDLSPDGKLIAVTRQESGTPAADIWVIDWAKQVPQKITNDPVDAIDPVWSPNGLQVAFTSYRKGNADIYVTNANGVGAERPLLESSANESVEDWSRDGKYIAFEYGKDAFQDIWALPIENDKPGKPFPVIEGKFQKNEPQFSKDGKWLAYTADQNEAGKFQVYVVSFPVPDRKLQVSTDGGGQPRWSWDNKRVYYRTGDNRFASVDMTLGDKLQASPPTILGAAPTNNPTAADLTRHMFSISVEGSFLMRIPAGAATVGATGGAGPLLPITITPAGGGGATAAARGPVSSGLTAILHWASLLQKGGK
ncbi:MAG: serine/threonine-protein kinase [Acidobacteria bacterium]|nr:MAG: serine/threonine-protein kinase [Acidobacteriota bacterium]